MPVSRNHKPKRKKGSKPPKTNLVAQLPKTEYARFDEPAKKLVEAMNQDILNNVQQ